jgi:hypothetical protein
MKTRISKSDFYFEYAGHGHYYVTYTSPVTGKKWSTLTDDMTIIDATKNADNPKIKDLENLKRFCKS